MKYTGKTIVDAATLLTAIAAMAVAAMVLFGHSKPVVVTHEDQVLDDWRTHASGHWVGPENPKVTIITWTDFECSGCRDLHGLIKDAVVRHPNDLAVVHRHWPLSYHQLAYPAARAAECAARQGAFERFRDQLFENTNWVGDAFDHFASEAGVRDLPSFRECVRSTEPVPGIERDIRAAEELDLRGTPAVVVNGIYLGVPPRDSEELERIINNAKDGAKD